MYIAFLNIVPILDLVGTVTGYIAQYKKIRETKNSEGISIIKQGIHLILLLCWILYGIEYCTTTYIVTCILSLILCLFEIILTLWYRVDVTFKRLRILSKIIGFKQQPARLHSTNRFLR